MPLVVVGADERRVVLFIKVAIVAVWWHELQIGRLICCGCSLREVLLVWLVVVVMVILLIVAMGMLLMGSVAP